MWHVMSRAEAGGLIDRTIGEGGKTLGGARGGSAAAGVGAPLHAAACTGYYSRMAPREAQLAQDPTAAVECHRLDDRFVPLRVRDLVAALAGECEAAGLDGLAFTEFAAALIDVTEQQAAAFERDLADQYSFFNPDRDTLPLESDIAARMPAGYAALASRLSYLLDKANFQKLDDVQFDRVVQVASSRGLTVRLDPARLEDLAVYVRGHDEIDRPRRTWRAPLRGRVETLPVYRRLVVIARLKDDPHVLLKMFKDIPEADVEALLPHAEVTMNWIDRLFMMGGGVGAIGSTVTQVSKIISASLIVISRLLWVVLFGTVVLMWRTFSGYRRVRQSRDALRSRHLYFQNVSNNAGALNMLIAMITQEEIKEALLAYFFHARDGERPTTEADLRRHVETWLHERFDTEVDFDAADARESLDAHDLWEDREAGRVIPPGEAAVRLRQAWAEHRSENYHQQCRLGRSISHG